MAKGFAVLLSPESPKEILELIADYIQERHSLQFAFCNSVDYHGFYVEIELIRKGRKGSWVVSIPASCVLAICDASGSKKEIGFLSTK